MKRNQYKANLGNSVYTLVWECLKETDHYSHEYVELRRDGQHMGGFHAFSYEAAKERFDDLRRMLDAF